jgi:hypothetical protein
VGRASSRVNEGWGRLPIGMASGPDHGWGDSSHMQPCRGRQEGKRGGQRERPAKKCRDGSRALGSEEGSKVNKQVLITGNRETERGEGE